MNIYKSGHYKVLTAIALLLFALSLYFIPKIRLGTEFKGGLLITIDTKTAVDSSALQNSLISAGYRDVVVRSSETPFGYRIEIEMMAPEELDEARSLYSRLQLLVKNWSYGIVRNEDASFYQREALSVLDQLATLSNSEFKEQNVTPTQALNYGEIYLKALKEKYTAELNNILSKYVSKESIKIQDVSPLLGKDFLENAKRIAVLSALLAAIVVYGIFRKFWPSLAVIIGALSDIVIALGFLGLSGIPLNLATFSALLVLVGYSLDTDILLTSRVLKRGSSPEEKAQSAMNTGLTMTFTGMLAFVILLVVGYILKISIYYQIAAVVLAGLVGDIFATWGINAILVLKAGENT